MIILLFIHLTFPLIKRSFVKFAKVAHHTFPVPQANPKILKLPLSEWVDLFSDDQLTDVLKNTFSWIYDDDDQSGSSLTLTLNFILWFRSFPPKAHCALSQMYWLFCVQLDYFNIPVRRDLICLSHYLSSPSLFLSHLSWELETHLSPTPVSVAGTTWLITSLIKTLWERARESFVLPLALLRATPNNHRPKTKPRP